MGFEPWAFGLPTEPSPMSHCLFQSFSLVIATNLDEKTAITLSNILWSSNTPFMLVRSYGLVGYIRLQVGHTYKVAEGSRHLSTISISV